MPETTTGPARIAAQPPAAPSPTPGTPETDPADLDAIAARNAHRRCHHCDMPLDDDQRCPNCAHDTPDDIGALLAEVRRLRHQHGKVAGELADATMTMWHLEPGDRSDMPLAERITTLVAELARQRDTARRDGAADALELFAAEHPLCSGHHRAQLNAWAVEVRAGGRTIPTTEGDHHD